MKKILVCLLVLSSIIINISARDHSYLKLWYRQPAKQWVEALPVGNGRLGAMIYGDPVNEIIQLNENTVWAGQPYRNENPDAKAALPEVRELIFEGKFKEAQDLVDQTFISKISHGMPYQTVGNLNLHFRGLENYSDYYRELDIDRAIVTSRFKVNEVNYSTSIYSSFPDQVMVYKITADKPGSLNFYATMDRPSGADVSITGNDEITLTGLTGDFDKVKGGALRFTARVKVFASGGVVSTNDTSLVVSNANDAIIFISIATNFKNYRDISGDADKIAGDYLSAAVSKNHDQLLNDHINDYQKYFRRVSLDLGTTDAVNNPTDIRLDQFAKGNDPQLVSLYFQFGRYLLISSSRPGGQPANLQGIWNDQLTPSWDSKYTVNINTEMNYWPSEVTNLTEMNEPLMKMVRELAEAGRQTASDMYGADGWVLHHNTDIWRMTGPIDGAFWGQWPMGGAWLSQHM
ncbi:MAG: glycoside hydrolase family 95 protein, partial [Bacteroidales bacterium]|nr:glycoside hydrolase family 95 protein [Bacteroidales bacterium]